MLLLLFLGAASGTPPPAPVRAYAALSFALNNDGALGFSLVNSGDLTISETTSTEGSVS